MTITALRIGNIVAGLIMTISGIIQLRAEYCDGQDGIITKAQTAQIRKESYRSNQTGGVL